MTRDEFIKECNRIEKLIRTEFSHSQGTHGGDSWEYTSAAAGDLYEWEIADTAMHMEIISIF